jgi:hypothetical protein
MPGAIYKRKEDGRSLRALSELLYYDAFHLWFSLQSSFESPHRCLWLTDGGTGLKSLSVLPSWVQRVWKASCGWLWMFGITGWLQRWLSESDGQAQLQMTAWKKMRLMGNPSKTPTSFRNQPGLIMSVTNRVQVTYLLWSFGRLASFKESLWFKMPGLVTAWIR